MCVVAQHTAIGVVSLHLLLYITRVAVVACVCVCGGVRAGCTVASAAVRRWVCVCVCWLVGVRIVFIEWERRLRVSVWVFAAVRVWVVCVFVCGPGGRLVDRLLRVRRL